MRPSRNTRTACPLPWVSTSFPVERLTARVWCRASSSRCSNCPVRLTLILPSMHSDDGLALRALGALSRRRLPRALAEQEPQQEALERRLAVDAVVVGAAEEGLGDLGQAAARVRVLGPR